MRKKNSEFRANQLTRLVVEAGLWEEKKALKNMLEENLEFGQISKLKSKVERQKLDGPACKEGGNYGAACEPLTIEGVSAKKVF